MVKTARFSRVPTDEEELELSPLNTTNGETETGASARVATTSNGYQHITNVLEESYRRPAWAEDWAFYLSRNPNSYCNWISIVWACIAIFLSFLILMGEVPAQIPTSLGHCKTINSTAASVETASGIPDWQHEYAPQGIKNDSFSLYHDYRGKPRAAMGKHGAVAADHGRCADMGLAILCSGGNAVDAMVTTTLCQGVMSPGASGIGGGHFAVIRTPQGTAEVIDAREVAPAAATEDMFKGRPELALEGGLSVAVPMELKGLFTAHKKHGQLTWRNVVEPVIPFARNGFPAHPYLVEQLNRSVSKMLLYPHTRDAFLVNDGGQWRAPRVNETCCKRTQLAQLLEDVAADPEGPAVLYEGSYAKKLAEDIHEAGGIITLQDLKSAQAEIKEPIRGTAFGMDIITAPPPSSGVVLIPILNVLAGYDLPLTSAGFVGIHRLVEAMKHGFALRIALGDPGNPPDNFLNLTSMLEDIITQEYADDLRSVLRDKEVLAANEYGGPHSGVHFLPDDAGTSHISIADSHGWSVALTSTINTGFGSFVTSKSTGILLNNEMDDFSTPGQPNVYHLHPSPSNYIRPGKKPLSSMSPTIIESGGEVRMVVGGSGGPTIISGVLQTIVRHLLMGWHPFDAVASPRLHNQLLPEVTYAESWTAHGTAFNTSSRLIKDLKTRGHKVNTTSFAAVTQAVVIDTDTQWMLAVSDPRKDGAPAVF